MKARATILTLAIGMISFDSQAAPASAVSTAYKKEIRPLLIRYCQDCHADGARKGKLDFDRFPTFQSAFSEPETWSDIQDNLQFHTMPPDGKPQPTESERKRIVQWIGDAVLQCGDSQRDPGRVTLRRLNRVEYQNTIRDLVGVDFQAAGEFPADDIGYGFDNIGDVLSLPPVLMEKYLNAAERILDEAIVRNAPPQAIAAPSLPETHRRIFTRQPTRENASETARSIIDGFAARAYRRPLREVEINRLMSLFGATQAENASFVESVETALTAVLISPRFLFRGEFQPEPDNPNAIHPVDEFALASRLSYFLWSSIPDAELFDLAHKGSLRQNLEPQVRRMMADPRSEALSENFASQWLQLRDLDLARPDKQLFPEFDESLRAAMGRETRRFFQHIQQNDLSALRFLDADFSFVNERLARHYGIQDVQGARFRKVSLRETKRRGLLSHASVLTITSNPTRTSPVKRGLWTLENLLGFPPPPPPPDATSLKEDARVDATSLRERLEQHRANPACASCHARMDPIGFGLENFDAVGAWRDRADRLPIDARGVLVTGQSFNGPTELRQTISVELQDNFLRCLAEKMLTYALGRGLEYYDKCAIAEIVEKMKANDLRFSSLIMAIVKSAPFQMRRGEG